MAGKHTLRRNVNNGRSDMPYSMKIENVDRFSMAHEDGSVEVALSTIDSLLAKHGVFAAENAHSNGNLNKQGLWDSLLEELEITCLRKEERMNVAQNSYETVYTVPVTGHQLLLPMIEEDRHLGSYNVLQEKDTNKVSQKAERLNKSMMKKIKLNPQQVRT